MNNGFRLKLPLKILNIIISEVNNAPKYIPEHLAHTKKWFPLKDKEAVSFWWQTKEKEYLSHSSMKGLVVNCRAMIGNKNPAHQIERKKTISSFIVAGLLIPRTIFSSKLSYVAEWFNLKFIVAKISKCS